MDYYKLKVLNNKRKIVIAFFIILLIGCFSYYFLVYQKENETIVKEEPIKNEEKHNDESDNIFVDIKGFVAKPGVYEFLLSEKPRVNDLIIKAGGLKKEADTSLINLSKKLEDEMTVIIYSKNEVEKFTNKSDDLKKKLEICEYKLQNNACIKNDVIETNHLININTSSKEELMTLSGIGESKALAIIAYRNKSPFKKIDDIKNVEGIGESVFEKIKNNITT